MLYERSLTIERRLNKTLDLIRSGNYSTPSLAQTLGVSIPTASRCITALRERGYDIRPTRRADGWSYVLMPVGRPAAHPGSSPAFRTVDART